MLTECTKEAATVADAVDAALEELGVQQDAVEYEVIEEPGHKRFGLGSGARRQGARLGEALLSWPILNSRMSTRAEERGGPAGGTQGRSIRANFPTRIWTG